MAGMDNIIGRIAGAPFETVGRSESWAEQRVATVRVVGKYDQLEGKVKPGDCMADFSGWFGNASSSQYYVRTADLRSPDGVTGELQLTLLKCADGKNLPYNVTWDVSMEEVQTRLINHPKVVENCDIDILLAWEETPKRMRVAKDDNGELKFYYIIGTYSATGEPDVYAVEGDWNIAYCKAVTQGIDTFNRYLPVVTKNSFYLELNGLDYNDEHQITGGTVKNFTGSDKIGSFGEPDLKVRGYSSENGVWFKSGDKLTSQADGTWVRTETWVFSNDPQHKWIYTGQL